MSKDIRLNKRGKKLKKKLVNQNLKLSPSDIVAIETLLDASGDCESFAVQYLSTEFRSKYNNGSAESAQQRRTAAIEKWLSVESDNALFTQQYIARDPGFNILPRVAHERFVLFVKRLISDVLGDLTDSIVLGSFSGGASTSRPRTLSQKAEKFVGQADLTQSASAFIDVIHREAPLLRQHGTFYDLRVVEGAVLFTVPKNADIDRCACKEPDINMYLQKGVGKHIRSRLRFFGIDLNDQGKNRELARQGSLDGSLATIDLSSASDTINGCVVEDLLPTDWFLYLNDIRSASVKVNEVYHRTAMFSSMGNGFTFELESLIFWALMKAVAYFRGIRGAISVYGDDIIVPSEGYDYFLWALKMFGFKPNPKKSFGSGPFRESCGGHYHCGEDVTPFYLRKPPTRLVDLIRIANQLRRWIFADPSRQYTETWALAKWRELRSRVPVDFWGGHDFQLDTRLVTHGPAALTLSRVANARVVSELGRYLAWHCDNWKRETVKDSPQWGVLDTTVVCRKRRVNSTTCWAEPLWEEMF